MKCGNRWIGFVLCFVMMVNLFAFLQEDITVQAEQDITRCEVPVISNEYEESYVDIYETGGRYYLSVEDIAAFTRCSLEESTSAITLTQGVRQVVIEKKTGHMYDFSGIDQGNILFLEQNGNYLYEAIPMLTYLGASCSVGEGNVLEIFMPMYTLWEAIMPNYENLLFDMEVIHGSVGDLKGNLICAMISDILDVRKGHGIFANGDTYIEDALHEILKLDMMQYSIVQEEMAVQNQKANNFLASDGVQNYLKQQEKWDEVARKLFGKYFDICMDAKSEATLEGFRQLYDKIITEFEIKNEEALGNGIKAGSVAFDVMKTSQEIMNYDEAAKSLFTRTINDEVLAYAGYNDIIWSENAKKLSKELTSNQSIVASTAIDKLAGEVLNEVQTKGLEFVLSKYVSKANIYTAAVEVGGYIASLLNADLHEAFYSERSAVYLNVMQYDAVKLLDGLLLNCKEKEQFSDEKVLEHIKSVLELYYRASAAFSVHMAKSVEQFGEGSTAEASRYFKEDVGNAAALYLYFATNCKVVPIRDYQTLVKNVGTTNVEEFLTAHFEEELSKQEKVQEYLAKSDEYLKAGDCVAAVEILMEGQKYVDSDGLKEREEYLRENIVLVQSVKKEFDDKGTYSGEYRYEYDVEGRCIKEERYDSEGECKWEYKFSYNKKGEKIREEREIKEGEYWDYREVCYEYDNQGNYTKIQYGNGFEKELEFIWEYDKHGNEIMHSYYDYYRDSELIYKHIYEYDYDEFNNPVRVRAYDYEEKDDSYTLFWVGVYAYDEEGELKEFTRYDGNLNIEWCDKYDMSGNVYKTITYDEEGQVNSQIEYMYDQSNNIIQELWYDREKNNTRKKEDIYNEYGNCVKRVWHDAQGNTIYLREYEYDLFQNVTMCKTSEYGEANTTKYSNVYKLKTLLNTFKPTSLYGVWDSEDGSTRVIFEESFGFPMMATMGNIMPEGEIKIIDLEDASVLRGEYVTDTTGLYVLFSGLESREYGFFFDGETVTIENMNFHWMDNALVNQLIGTWINDDLQITFDENNNVEQEGTQNRDGTYFVLSETEVLINLDGQAPRIYEYSVEKKCLRINGLLLNKEGEDTSYASILALRSKLFGTWKESNGEQCYVFKPDGTYEYYATDMRYSIGVPNEKGIFDAASVNEIKFHREEAFSWSYYTVEFGKEMELNIGGSNFEKLQ